MAKNRDRALASPQQDVGLVQVEDQRLLDQEGEAGGDDLERRLEVALVGQADETRSAASAAASQEPAAEVDKRASGPGDCRRLPHDQGW